MRAIFHVAIIATVINVGWADNPFSEMKIKIFNQQNSIETDFRDGIKSIETKFDDQFPSAGIAGNIQDGVGIATIVTAPISFVGEFFGLVSSFLAVVLKDGDWQSEVK